MVHDFIFYIVSRPELYLGLLIVARLALCTTIERKFPAHDLELRRVFLRDVGAAIVFLYAVVPAAEFINRYIAFRPVLPASIMELPLVARFCLYLVIADFGHYWVHRAMHTTHLWRIHKWHHYPTYMYWLAGTRGSLIQQVLVNIPYILGGVLLDIAPWWMAIALVTKNSLQNDWMHLNVSWGNRWLEWFIITPRYHHIHHSDNPQHYRGNLATLFTIWDRLFGTYVDPDTVPRKLSFGIGERVSPVRLVIGV